LIGMAAFGSKGMLNRCISCTHLALRTTHSCGGSTWPMGRGGPTASAANQS